VLDALWCLPLAGAHTTSVVPHQTKGDDGGGIVHLLYPQECNVLRFETIDMLLAFGSRIGSCCSKVLLHECLELLLQL
jgi:hypothetical protein